MTTFTGESISIVGGAESGVNRVCSNHSNNKTANNARQSFGGYKLSDIGSKAGEPDYLLQFLDPRTVTENIQRQGFAPIEGMK